MREIADFVSANHGSIVTLTASTQSALDWIDQNIDAEASAHFGAVNIEPRYFLDIAYAIIADGLSLQDGATGRIASLPADA